MWNKRQQRIKKYWKGGVLLSRMQGIRFLVHALKRMSSCSSAVTR